MPNAVKPAGALRIWLPHLIKGLVTVGMFVLIARSIDTGRTAALLGGTSPGLFLAACFVLVGQALLAVARWQLVLRHQTIRFAFPKLVRYFWLGLFFNQVLPSSVGGDAMRAYCLVRDGCGIGSASVAVLLDRMCGMIGLVILVFVCLPLSFSYISDPATRWGVLVVACAAASAIGAVLVLDRLTAELRRWRIARGMTTLSRDARSLLFSSGWGGRITFISIGVHLISVVTIGTLALAAQLEVHWLAFLIVVPLASLLMTVPISIAGWGIREGVMVVGLGYAGMDPEQAVALSVLYGILLMAVSLPGGLVWLMEERRPPETLMR